MRLEWAQFLGSSFLNISLMMFILQTGYSHLFQFFGRSLINKGIVTFGSLLFFTGISFVALIFGVFPMHEIQKEGDE